MTRTSPLLLALLAIVALALSASLLAGLRHALRGREKAQPELTPRELDRRRVREALGDLLAPPIDFSKWPAHLRPSADMPDRDTLMRSMPILDPPLSQTVREERDESRY